MLMESPYKTAAELGITQEEREALIALSRDLANEAVEGFTMNNWCYCIWGCMRRRMSAGMSPMPDDTTSKALFPLFHAHTRAAWGGQGYVSDNQRRAAQEIQTFLMGA